MARAGEVGGLRGRLGTGGDRRGAELTARHGGVEALAAGQRVEGDAEVHAVDEEGRVPAGGVEQAPDYDEAAGTRERAAPVHVRGGGGGRRGRLPRFKGPRPLQRARARLIGVVGIG